MKHTTHVNSMRSLRVAAALVAVIATMLVPSTASAVTQVAPEDGAHLDWVQLRPTVTFDVADGEKPKWVLLAIDSGMTQTVRYCRQFFATYTPTGWHWACNAWATGTDWMGNDVLRPLAWGKTYYWHVAYTDAADVEQKTAARAFVINNVPNMLDPGTISDQIWGSVVSDGTTLNTGAAAFVNSGLRATGLHSVRVTRNRFRIEVAYEGGVDLSRSYVRIRSRAGTRYVRLTAMATKRAQATWIRSTAEQRIRPQTYRYQAFLKSTKNGAMVKSELRLLVIRTRTTTTVPTWTPY